MENTSEVLKEIGFSNGEIKVYFALFGLDETSVGPIAEKSGISHAKVYPILNKLIEKGLVSYTIKDNIKHFSAANPKNLSLFLDTKIRLINDEKRRIEKIIPALLEKQKEQEKIQYSRVFEGFKGLKNLFYDLFENSEGKEICVFGLNELLKIEEFHNFFLFYHELRIKNKIKLRVMFNKKMEKIVKKEYPYKKMYTTKDKIRFVNFDFPTGIFIFADHVISIVVADKVTAFDIKSKQNCKNYLEFFDNLWYGAKK